MAAIYSNGGNRWNILGFNFTKRDALSSVCKISMVAGLQWDDIIIYGSDQAEHDKQLEKVLTRL
jgi:hypothetical protein